MKVRVVALDSKLANLAILKIAQYHLKKGDNVDWYNPIFDIDCDLLYISKIFTFSESSFYAPPNAKVIYGGSGYDLKTVLPEEIESITDIKQAYLKLYPNIKYSVLFTTRGCPNKCGFCIVPTKEGMIRSVTPTTLNPNGKYIELLDNNFFNENNWRERLAYLKSLDQPINFNTGIDIRTLTEEQARELKNLKIKYIHIAWDAVEDENKVRKGLDIILKYVKPHKKTCYVLVGYKQKHIVFEDIYRVQELYKYKITPFAMGYRDFDDKKYQRHQTVIDFCRWTNRYMYKKFSFEEYKKTRKV